MLLSIDCKRGDTFAVVLDYQPDGVPTSLAGATVESQIRAEGFEQDLTVTLADQGATPGRVTLSCAYADTAQWPLGEARGDIQVTIGGVRRSSSDFLVQVLEDQTR